MHDDLGETERASQRAANELTSQGLTIVPTAVIPGCADAAARILRDQPDDAWSITVHKGAPSAPNTITNTLANRGALDADIGLARQTFLAGKFSYYFLRCKADHADGCDCALCVLPYLLQARLSRIIRAGYDSPARDIAGSFFSWYPPGSFLGPHSDKRNGTVGFVLSLTKWWLPQWGGLLHFDMSRLSRPSLWVTSEYNSLLLFEVGRFTRFPHFVTPVSDCVTEKRITITGWFT